MSDLDDLESWHAAWLMEKNSDTAYAAGIVAAADACMNRLPKLIAKLQAAEDLAYVAEHHECDSAPDFRGLRVKLTLQQALDAYRKAGEP